VSSQDGSKLTRSQFDAYSKSYDGEVNKALAFSGLNVDFFTRVKAEYLIELIGSTRPPAAAGVLDLGCGIGNFHPLIASRVGKLAGVDVSASCIDEARDRNSGCEYNTFDGVNLPFGEQTFDVVFAVSVFHHVAVAQRLPLVSEVWRVLKGGGVFVIFEHNPLNPLTTYVVKNCEFDADAILLRRRDAEALLQQGNFSEIATRFILTVPAANKFLRTVDRCFSKLPFGAQYYTSGRRV
jgi:ubiquinone/menaquinone biosynthesis C-methylase UbiE